jgi:hypothetical protein
MNIDPSPSQCAGDQLDANAHIQSIVEQRAYDYYCAKFKTGKASSRIFRIVLFFIVIAALIHQRAPVWGIAAYLGICFLLADTARQNERFEALLHILKSKKEAH